MEKERNRWNIPFILLQCLLMLGAVLRFFRENGEKQWDFKLFFLLLFLWIVFSVILFYKSGPGMEMQRGLTISFATAVFATSLARMFSKPETLEGIGREQIFWEYVLFFILLLPMSLYIWGILRSISIRSHVKFLLLFVGPMVHLLVILLCGWGGLSAMMICLVYLCALVFYPKLMQKIYERTYGYLMLVYGVFLMPFCNVHINFLTRDISKWIIKIFQ